MAPDTRIEIEAHAKINLTLEVVGRRGDGYHDIVSIMQTVGLHDVVTLEPAERLTLACDPPELESPDNLAIRAARLLQEHTGHSAGAAVSLAKRIPVAAGLGGGSSDAAAVLVGLNRLWGLGLSRQELTPLAAVLGSDVPFFLEGGTAMVSGRGERVRALPPADLRWFVVLSPEIDMPDKTRRVYSHLTKTSFTTGQLTRKLEARIRGKGDVPPQFLFNVFDDVAPEVFPELRRYRDAFLHVGAREVHVAGSGPSLYAPVSRRELGTAIELLLRHTHGWRVHLTPAWRPPPTDDA